MTRFNKHIFDAAKYLVMGAAGQRHEEDFSPQRMERLAKRHLEMRAAGLNVPAPYRHDPNAVPSLNVDAKDNAGYWETFHYDTDKQKFYGVLDVPNSSDAEKVGTTIKEVSPLIANDWVDGNGRKWEGESMLHVALVQHPVVPGQENFQPIPEAIAASLGGMFMLSLGDRLVQSGEKTVRVADLLMSHDPSVIPETPSIKDVLESLRKLGLDLPDDTTQANLSDRITVACRALAAVNTDPAGDETRNKPQGSETQKNTVTMSNTINDNPQYKQVLALATNDRRTLLRNRVNQLVASGRTTQEYATANFVPQIESFQLSFDANGAALQTSNLEAVLSALEAIPAPARPAAPNRTTPLTGGGVDAGAAFGLSHDLGGQRPEGSTVEPNDGAPTAMTEERAEELAKQNAAMLGQR